MGPQLLTEGDLDRGHPPDCKHWHWRCCVVDDATGAVCTLRPHGDDQSHKGVQAVEGARRATRTVSWTGGTQRAMIVDGYTWTTIPGTDFEVRVLGVRPLALRYQPMHPRGRGPREAAAPASEPAPPGLFCPSTCPGWTHENAPPTV